MSNMAFSRRISYLTLPLHWGYGHGPHIKGLQEPACRLLGSGKAPKGVLMRGFNLLTVQTKDFAYTNPHFRG